MIEPEKGMEKTLTLTCLTAVLFLMALAAPAHPQGTAADYERANNLRERTANKVARAAVRPQWLEGDRFWYRNDLAGGRREFVLVDPSVPSKRPAFDHKKLAASLSKALGKDLDPERLPVDRIAFDHADSLRVQVADRTFAVDRKTGALTETEEPLGRLTPRDPADAPRASRDGGEDTEVAFLNRTGETVSLVWLDTDGTRRPYATLKPGESRRQHTFSRHVWLALRENGQPLAGFVAEDDAALAVIEKEPPRRERGGDSDSSSPPESEVSPDGRWKALVRDHNVVLTEASSGEETPLTKDGSVADAYEGRIYWSPDSKHLVVLRTIPAEEHKLTLIESSPADQVQPKVHTYDYLKPGDRIAHPRPRLFDVESRLPIPVPEDLFPNPWEITDVHWDPDGRRFTFLYNQRGHQVMRLIAVDARTGAATTVIDEQAKTFIDWTNKVYLHRLEKTGEAVWMSERDGWNHLYLFDTRTGQVNALGCPRSRFCVPLGLLAG
jgi:dipeptidyl aminopeptidase/acylaminoacyl peptidase/cation transport regulator ChaB